MEPIKPAFQAAPNVKVMINIGACLDICTGTYLYGQRGESILNGGLGNLTGVTGIGNSFKSTTADYMFLKAAARVGATVMNKYDTEINVHEHRLTAMAQAIEEWDNENIIDNGKYVITDKTRHTGDEWYDLLKDFLLLKKKNEKEMSITTPFMNRERTDNLRIIQPSFTAVDSLSEFVTSDVMRMQDENLLGESGANTMSMRQGLQKNRFLMEMPGLAGASYNYTIMTAHVGNEFALDPRQPPTKKLAFLRQGTKLKGVPEKFTFVMNNCWFAIQTTQLVNQGTKAPEYPRDTDDNMAGDTDLFEVYLCQLRGKSGPTGIRVMLVVSQEDGVLDSLTEFHHIKEQDRFGLEGNVQNYFLSLCPEIKLSRTVVRGKIDRHPELRRALNITSEMCQMNYLWHTLDAKYKVTPKQLYDDLKALGYDWNQILTQTRGWWAPMGMHEDLKFLSTMDLLRMRVGEYIPYWEENPPAKALELHNSKHDCAWTSPLKDPKSWKKPQLLKN